MPRLIHRIPFSSKPSEVIVRGERVRIRKDQIVVWVSISRFRESSPSPLFPPFPALLDTGHNYTFSIQQRHLIEWTGFSLERLPLVGTVREQGRQVRLHGADLWIYVNLPGKTSLLADHPPHKIEAPHGIAVYPFGIEFPRLPILGLRAIVDNKLVLHINGERREATLRTAHTWWPFKGR